MIYGVVEGEIVQDCMSAIGDWKVVNVFNGEVLLDGVNRIAARAVARSNALCAVVPQDWSWESYGTANKWLSPDRKKGVDFSLGFFDLTHVGPHFQRERNMAGFFENVQEWLQSKGAHSALVKVDGRTFRMNANAFRLAREEDLSCPIFDTPGWMENTLRHSFLDDA